MQRNVQFNFIIKMVKSKIEKSEQLIIFRQHLDDLFDEGGKVKPCSADVYDALQSCLPGMTKKSIQISVKRHMDEILHLQPLESELSNLSVVEDICTEATKNCESESDFSDIDEIKNSNSEHINYSCDVKDKNIFAIVKVVSGEKSRSRVQSNWSSKLKNELWELCRKPCAWSFKRADVISGDIFVNGQCKQDNCKAEITVKVLNLHTMTVQIRHYDETVEHQKKCISKVDKKSKIATALSKSTAFKVRSEAADKLMNVGDPEPPQLPSMNAMRLQKSRENNKDLPHQDPVWSLCLMKRGAYKNIIGDISIDPFSVDYSTTVQRQWYANEHKKSRTILGKSIYFKYAT